MAETRYTIREARENEIKFLGAIERRAGQMFKTVGLEFVTEGEALPLDFARALARTGVALVAADEKDRVVGFALASFVDRDAHLYEISVDPGHGRRGLGGRLLAGIADWARSEGVSGITLATFRDVLWNAPFYQRHGYRILRHHEWTPGLYILRLREEDAGLPIARRCFMRKEL